MKHNKFIVCSILSAAILATLMQSCVSKVSMDEVNTKAEAEIGIGLPVGSITLKIKDFLGSMGNNIHVGVREQFDGRYEGVLLYQDTFFLPRTYHSIDLSKYMSKKSETFYVKDANNGVVISPINSSAVKELRFPLKLDLENVNNAMSDERLDSMYIAQARFYSTVNNSGFPGLTDNMVKGVRIEMGDQIHRAKGKSVDVPFSSFGQELPIMVDDFTINLMKNKNLKSNSKKDYDDNVISAIEFEIVLELKDGYTITYDAGSSISYTLRVDFLEYEALYGYFKPGPMMSDRDVHNIAEDWEDWAKFQELELHAAEPRIQMVVRHQIAAPLVIYIDTLWVNRLGENRIFATFNASGTQLTKDYPLTSEVKVTDPIGTIATNEFEATYEEGKGHLDRLFDAKPDILGYQYHLEIREGGLAVQHRLTNDTIIDVEAQLTLPFRFGKGMNITYSDVLEDLDFFKNLDLDSIQTSVDLIDSVKASDIKIILRAENTIPLDVKLKYAFFDKDDNEISLRNLITNINDTVVIYAPTNIDNKRNVLEPGISDIVINVDRDELDKLGKIEKMQFTATLMTDNESFEPNKSGEYPPSVDVLDKSQLRIQVGASAHVDADLDLGSIFGKDDDE